MEKKTGLEGKWEWEHVGSSRDGLIRTYRRQMEDGALFLTVVDGPVGPAAAAQTFVVDELDKLPIDPPEAEVVDPDAGK